MDRVVRLFVALVPPADVALGMLQAVQAGLDGGSLTLPAHRLILPTDLHMTLAFIGDTRAKGVRDVMESVDRACTGFGPLVLRPSTLVTIPTPQDGGPPRLLAVLTDAPSALIEIQRRLALRLTTPKRSGRRGRFLPHVTVLRYAHGQSSGDIELPALVPDWPVREVLLLQSTLNATGARYTPLHAAPLAT